MTINLVESAYLAHLTHGPATFPAFARACNAALDRTDSIRRWWEWRHGRKSIPAPVRHHLMQLALRHALRCAGLNGLVTARQIAEILPHLLPPERQ